jgi:hypothetical protein
MKKIIGALIISVGLIGMAGVASAKPSAEKVSPRAVEVAPHVFSLGEAIDPQSGKRVEGYMIVHPRSAGKKPDGTPGGGNGGGKPGGGGDDTSSCYGFLAKDAKWKTVEPWVVDPTNSEGLSEAEVFALLDGGITKWEDAADGIADGNVSFDILGKGSVSSGFATDGSLDGKNGVVFGDLEAGTIGVTTVWGVFGGPPPGRELVEWDQIYNTDFTWNTDGNGSDMDFESIATHELGHSFGLGDLYTSECSEETMYGYGSEGEIQARDLNAGDIAGISKLY